MLEKGQREKENREILRENPTYRETCTQDRHTRRHTDTDSQIHRNLKKKVLLYAWPRIEIKSFHN